MKKISFLIILLGLLSFGIFADEAPPPTPKPKKFKAIVTKLDVIVDPNTKAAKLIIPQHTLKKLAANYKGGGGKVALGSQSFGVSQTQTIAGGLFLSLAAVFGGIWITRKKGKRLTKKSIAMGAVVLFGLAVTFSYADVAPPSFETINSKMFSQKMINEQMGSGKIKVVISEHEYDDAIRLMVPLVKSEKKSEGRSKSE